MPALGISRRCGNRGRRLQSYGWLWTTAVMCDVAAWMVCSGDAGWCGKRGGDVAGRRSNGGQRQRGSLLISPSAAVSNLSREWTLDWVSGAGWGKLTRTYTEQIKERIKIVHNQTTSLVVMLGLKTWKVLGSKPIGCTIFYFSLHYINDKGFFRKKIYKW